MMERLHILRTSRAFTLIELVIATAVLMLLAALAVPRCARVLHRARYRAAEADLRTIAAAFTDPDTGYLRDFEGIPGFSKGSLRIANLLTPTNLYGCVARAGGEVALRVDGRVPVAGCARPETFMTWDPARARGWRGPYVKAPLGSFPPSGDGFYPPLSGLRLPDDIVSGRDGCSVYGFPGEPAILDPWGRPYVLQIPPPQAFPGPGSNVTDAVRFSYARVVSAGADGRLDTPCFAVNLTNRWETSWNERTRRLSRQAGRAGDDVSARGDDCLLFLYRNDCDEGEEAASW